MYALLTKFSLLLCKHDATSVTSDYDWVFWALRRYSEICWALWLLKLVETVGITFKYDVTMINHRVSLVNFSMVAGPDSSRFFYCWTLPKCSMKNKMGMDGMDGYGTYHQNS